MANQEGPMNRKSQEGVPSDGTLGVALGNRLHFCSPWGDCLPPRGQSGKQLKDFSIFAPLRNKSKMKMEGTKRLWGLCCSSPPPSECGRLGPEDTKWSASAPLPHWVSAVSRNPPAVQTLSSSLLGLTRVKRLQRQEAVVRDLPPYRTEVFPNLGNDV